MPKNVLVVGVFCTFFSSRPTPSPKLRDVLIDGDTVIGVGGGHRRLLSYLDLGATRSHQGQMWSTRLH